MIRNSVATGDRYGAKTAEFQAKQDTLSFVMAGLDPAIPIRKALPL
jgi:hypothetical protein